MAKWIIFISLSLCWLPANAECTISSKMSDYARNVFEQHGGWDLDQATFEEVCQKLKQANAGVSINAEGVVLNQQAISWASVAVYDLETGLDSSDFGKASTHINGLASQNVADKEMYMAMNKAIIGWRALDHALASLDAKRNRIKLTCRPGK